MANSYKYIYNLFLLLIIIISSLTFIFAKINYYSLEDVEKQRLKFKRGNKKSIELLIEIYQDKNQLYEVRLAAIRALAESREPQVIRDIQGSVKNATLIELDLMKEAIEIVISYKELSSTDSLIEALKSTEAKSLEIRKILLNAIGENSTQDEVTLLIQLYDASKRSNAAMNQLLAENLGKIGDQKVIPILMEIAKNKNLPINIRNRSVEILSKKQAPELVDFFVSLLGNAESSGQVNEYAMNIVGELSEEKMILALIESYQIGKNKYYSLLNTIMSGLDDFNNPKIKNVYKEIALSKDFPSKVRFKAFKGLTRFIDEPETIDMVIELLNSPENYVYYNEIVKILETNGISEINQNKLREAAFKAMKQDLDTN